ncbi:hypothetical protein QIS74_08458 [Colletotrichum tabaci]|uniref:Integral membrane protein n=1 Tax=Colletotrichum tabaci TaxID=1209068 RepID=A0AAV9T8I7_9PEZI
MPSVSTTDALAAQWINPSDISTILFILGGDVVQKAFSQGTGKVYIPVCFSFGCAAYAFIALVGIIGDGRLLSPSDYTCKVLNLGSEYVRESRNFVLGRLLRDLEAIESRRAGRKDENSDYSLRISVYEAQWNGNAPTEFSWSHIHLVGAVVTLIQFGLALVPLVINRSWNVLLITAAGTMLVQWTGLLPQWRAEKLPNRQRSSQMFSLTSGNGSREVMVIVGLGRCLDLESFATMPSPRNSRPWEKFMSLSQPQQDRDDIPDVSRRDSMFRKAKRCHVWPFNGLPVGFIVTQVSCIVISVLWLFLLVNVSASKTMSESWCLLGIGGLGMFQNVWLAAAEMPPEMRNLPLELVDQIKCNKVMDAIMDFHVTYGQGKPLRDEFFPGTLKEDEKAWWNGQREKYESQRLNSRSRAPSRYKNPHTFKRGTYRGVALEVRDEAAVTQERHTPPATFDGSAVGSNSSPSLEFHRSAEEMRSGYRSRDTVYDPRQETETEDGLDMRDF